MFISRHNSTLHFVVLRIWLKTMCQGQWRFDWEIALLVARHQYTSRPPNIYISTYLHIYTSTQSCSVSHGHADIHTAGHCCSAAVLQCSVILKCSEMIMFRLGLILAIKRSIVPHFSAEINCILMQKQWKLLMFRCCSYFKNAILHRLCRVEKTLYSRASLLQVFHDTMICTMKDIKQFLWASFIMRGGA